MVTTASSTFGLSGRSTPMKDGIPFSGIYRYPNIPVELTTAIEPIQLLREAPDIATIVRWATAHYVDTDVHSIEAITRNGRFVRGLAIFGTSNSGLVSKDLHLFFCDPVQPAGRWVQVLVYRNSIDVPMVNHAAIDSRKGEIVLGGNRYVGRTLRWDTHPKRVERRISLVNEIRIADEWIKRSERSQE